MKFRPALVVASALTLLPAGRSFAGDADRRALYTSAAVVSFFTKDKIADLNITPEQERGLQAIDARRKQIWGRHSAAMGKLSQSKLPKREEDAKVRALETQVSDDLFKLYAEVVRPEQIKRMKQIILQVHGMELFDYPEVRDALKVGDKEVKAMRATYNKLAKEWSAQVFADLKAKKITAEEADKKLWAMTFSVPEKVREHLSKDQRKVLDDLLGAKHVYK
jgi:hypothetical protein